MTETEKNINTTEETVIDNEKVDETPRNANEAEAEACENAECGDEKLSHGEKKKVKKLESRVAELEKKLESAEAAKKADDDRYLRMLAEYDNFRRRAAKEKEGIYTEAYSDAISALLPILDNLDRAVGCTDAAALAEGLALIMKSFGEALTKLGVEEIKAAGETFDPNLHNAVMHIEDESAGESEIVEVFQKGYKKGDKVIRHAVVKVAN